MRDIIETFEDFATTDFALDDNNNTEDDDDTSSQKRIETTDMGVLLALFLALGCDVDLPLAKDLYQRVKGPLYEHGKLSLGLVECGQLISLFVEEQCDPVDGLIEAISDAHDPSKTGACRLSDLKAFLEAHDYLGADKEAVLEVVERCSEGKGTIDYVKAIKRLIQ